MNNRATKNTSFKFGDNEAIVYSGNNKKSKNELLKKFGLLNSVCVFASLFIAANIINSISVEYNLNKQTNSLNAEMATVKDEHNKLKDQIKFFKSNEGIEKLARDSLGLIKNNELPVRYIENKK